MPMRATDPLTVSLATLLTVRPVLKVPFGKAAPPLLSFRRSGTAVYNIEFISII